VSMMRRTLLELGCGRRMICGEQRFQEAVVDLGVEDGIADAVWGEYVPVGVGVPPDRGFASELAQIVGHLCRGVRGSKEAGHMGAEAPIREAGYGI
jgi:hypothetical protein